MQKRNILGTTTSIALALFSHQLSAMPNAATTETIKNNKTVFETLPFENQEDYDNANKGFIATRSEPIKNEDGKTVWSLEKYNFLEKNKTPETINPSLFRHGQLNLKSGLYKVRDNIFQIRGFDISNMTIIEGEKSIIFIDPLLSMETAKAALDLYFENRPKKEIAAVIYTHSHPDHYGGVKGIISEEDVNSGKIKIIAPDNFLESAISENVYAGNAMSRRAIYQFGLTLQAGEKGHVDAGNGKAASKGTISLIPPTDIIKKTGETRTIDGIQIEFQMAPGTEAPSEMMMFFPQFNALCTAENTTQTLHNIYTLRGAQVRDAKAWWKALNESLHLFGNKTQVLFSSHTWPVWGQEQVASFLIDQRDIYKYLHDQTLRLMNQGQTMNEVAENISLPESLDKKWHNRGYYGTINHNIKGIYQYYLGWYDSNPSNLNPLPQTEAAKKYIEYMGGSRKAIEKAKEDYKKGNYRWVAEITNKIVFSDPENEEAKKLNADALEQLGYQAEAATWRNEYLTGAKELREGLPKPGLQTASPDTIRAMTGEMILDYMGIRINGPEANNKKIKINVKLSDEKTAYAMELGNSTLTYTKGDEHPQADASIITDKTTFANLAMGITKIDQINNNKKIEIQGDKNKVIELYDLFDKFDRVFPIVTP